MGANARDSKTEPPIIFIFENRMCPTILLSISATSESSGIKFSPFLIFSIEALAFQSIFVIF